MGKNNNSGSPRPAAASSSASIAKAGNQWIDRMQAFSATCDKLRPYGAAAQAKFKQFHGDVAAPIFLGIVMLLIGGQFPLVIAMIESVRLTAWNTIKTNVMMLYEDAVNFKKESDEDDKKDEDNNGVADVREISSKDLFRRKLMLFLSKPQNVERLRAGLTGLYIAMVSVLASLCVTVARILTLGGAVGNIIVSPLRIAFKDTLMNVNIPLPIPGAGASGVVETGNLSPETKARWVDMGLMYVSRAIGVTIVFFSNRLMNVVHASLRGANLVVENGELLLQRFGVDPFKDNARMREIAVYPVALIGMYSQLVAGYTFPWLFALPMLPVTIVEKILYALVAARNLHYAA